MVLQDLAFCQPSELESLSDQQLDEITKPFWPTCRPELAPKRESTHTGKTAKSTKSAALEADKQRAMKLAQQFGIDLKL